MRLHENQLLFKEAIVSAAQPKVNGGLGIKALFIEKDYWLCHYWQLVKSQNELCLKAERV